MMSRDANQLLSRLHAAAGRIEHYCETRPPVGSVRANCLNHIAKEALDAREDLGGEECHIRFKFCLELLEVSAGRLTNFGVKIVDCHGTTGILPQIRGTYPQAAAIDIAAVPPIVLSPSLRLAGIRIADIALEIRNLLIRTNASPIQYGEFGNEPGGRLGQ